MGKIQNDADVLAWAEWIAAENGDRFTPLSKGEQYLIAKFIYDRRGLFEVKPQEPLSEDCCKTMAEDKAEECCKDEQAATVPPPRDEQGDPVPPTTPLVQERMMPQKMKMSRGAAYHLAGTSAQKAFDEFLKWSNEHPQEACVMDFSNGQKSIAAAYAYWLHEIMDVSLTPKANG